MRASFSSRFIAEAEQINLYRSCCNVASVFFGSIKWLIRRQKRDCEPHTHSRTDGKYTVRSRVLAKNRVRRPSLEFGNFSFRSARPWRLIRERPLLRTAFQWLLGKFIQSAGNWYPDQEPSRPTDRRRLISKTGNIVRREWGATRPRACSESFLKIMNICCNIPEQITKNTDPRTSPQESSSLSNKPFRAIDPHTHSLSRTLINGSHNLPLMALALALLRPIASPLHLTWPCTRVCVCLAVIIRKLSVSSLRFLKGTSGQPFWPPARGYQRC